MAKCEMSLRAPTLDEIQSCLAPLLALCAPMGMTAQDRLEWITAAADTLQDVPADLLDDACRKARAVCDHPSKIIPFVMGEIAERKAMRQERHREILRELKPTPPETNKLWVDLGERKQVAEMMRDWRESGYSAAYARKRRWI